MIKIVNTFDMTKEQLMQRKQKLQDAYELCEDLIAECKLHIVQTNQEWPESDFIDILGKTQDFLKSCEHQADCALAGLEPEGEK